jgi:hypothetical protein
MFRNFLVWYLCLPTLLILVGFAIFSFFFSFLTTKCKEGTGGHLIEFQLIESVDRKFLIIWAFDWNCVLSLLQISIKWKASKISVNWLVKFRSRDKSQFRSTEIRSSDHFPKKEGGEKVKRRIQPKLKSFQRLLTVKLNLLFGIFIAKQYFEFQSH